MALVTANNVPVIEGTIVRPLIGVWTADLKLDQTGGTPTGFTPGTQVTIASENSYSLVGVVDPNRGGSFLDSVHVRILGGAGGIAAGTSATMRSYGQGTFARDVINSLMQDGGETLSSKTDAGLLATSLNAWAILGHTIGWNLRALLRLLAPTMSWRILPDGTVWIGSETWPAASGTFDAIDQDPADGSFVLGVEAPFVVPGTNISGVGNVNTCIDVITARRLRTHVYVDFPGEGARDLNSTVGRIVAQKLAGIDYYATYICEVVSQSSDFTTVDVQPHNTYTKQILKGLSSVPVRAGTGIKTQIPPNATVLLSWDGGDPRYPYVWGGFSGDSVQKIQLAGTHPAPLWDTFQSDLNALLGVVAIIIASSTVAGPLTGLALAYVGPPHVPPFATNADALTGLVASLAVATSYQSQIVSNG